MAVELGGRAERRRAQRLRQRRIKIIGASGAAAVLTIAGIVVAVGGGGDGDADRVSASTRSTSTSSVSTTSSVPTSTTIVPKSTNPVVALAQQYDGTYAGTFTNTTFNTTGPTHLVLQIDPVAGSLVVVADFSGDIFGGGAPAGERRIESTVSLGNPTAQAVTDTKSFGKVSGRIGTGFSVELSALNVPEPIVKSFELTGRLRDDRTGFDGTYHVVFENGSTADGVVTLICAAQGQRPSEVKTVCPAA